MLMTDCFEFIGILNFSTIAMAFLIKQHPILFFWRMQFTTDVFLPLPTRAQAYSVDTMFHTNTIRINGISSTTNRWWHLHVIEAMVNHFSPEYSSLEKTLVQITRQHAMLQNLSTKSVDAKQNIFAFLLFLN